MTWNLEELRNLCAAKGLPDSTVYQNALYWKLQRADFHKKQSETIWSNLFSAHQELQIYGEEWIQAQFAYESHVEAAMQSLHSMADILAQIINQAILNGALLEDEVSFSGVLDRLKCPYSAHRGHLGCYGPNCLEV
ncbi:MAG TPA: hypothetical protein VJ793_01410 [Anaerolineae bacterium]|nr:hypothetical protein [Anaerolineae bacterium]